MYRMDKISAISKAFLSTLSIEAYSNKTIIGADFKAQPRDVIKILCSSPVHPKEFTNFNNPMA